MAIEMKILFLEKAVGTLLHIFKRSILKEEWSLSSAGTSAWDLVTLWLSHNEVGELNQHGWLDSSKELMSDVGRHELKAWRRDKWDVCLVGGGWVGEGWVLDRGQGRVGNKGKARAKDRIELGTKAK